MKYIKLQSANKKSYEFTKAFIAIGNSYQKISQEFNINIKHEGISHFKKGVLIIHEILKQKYPDKNISIKEIKKLRGRRKRLPLLTNHFISNNATQIFEVFIKVFKTINTNCEKNELFHIIFEDNCLDTFLYQIKESLTKKYNQYANYNMIEYMKTCENLKVELYDIAGQEKCCQN